MANGFIKLNDRQKDVRKVAQLKLTSFGRKRIYTDEVEITAKNVRQVVIDALSIHECNVLDIKTLYAIAKNDQELSRVKEVRKEIDVRATDPIASQIIDFKQAYEFGKPILYLQRANIDSGNANGDNEVAMKDDLRIATFNEMMRECKKASEDSKMARDIKCCGVGYRFIHPKDEKKIKKGIAPFDIYTLNPLRTFVIYSNDVFCTPLASVTYTVNKTNQIKRFGVWTDDYYFEFDTKEPTMPVKVQANPIGSQPIIEYINNYDIMGCFEKELPLIDAYNIVTSDRVNDVCQQVQSILWLHNTKLDTEGKERLVEGGVIQTQANQDGKEAKIEYVSAPLRQSDVQTLASSLKERILESSGVPKLSEGSNSTGQAMLVTNGWQVAENHANTSELTWRESEDRMIEVCLKIIKDANVTINGVNELELSDIDYKMHRQENYDIISRVNALVTLTDRGYDLEKSVEICRVSDDPLQFALDSKENVDRLRFAQLNETASVETSSLNVKNDENEPINSVKSAVVNIDKKKTEESIQPDTVRK